MTKVTIKAGTEKSEKADVLVLTVYDGRTLKRAGRLIDERLGGWLTTCLEGAGKFSGKSGETMIAPMPKGAPYKKIMFVGAGGDNSFSKQSAELLGQPILRALQAEEFSHADFLFDTPKKSEILTEEAAAAAADGMVRSSYSFSKYKTEGAKAAGTKVTMIVNDVSKFKKLYAPLSSLTESANWARDLVNEPGNVLYPETYAKEIEKVLSPLGIKVKILEEKELKAERMNTLLSVGQGSSKPSRVVVMEYDGSNGGQKQPLALVGKGVTFDSGGISIKPGAGMDEMKMDMGGSAAVVGAMRALAARGAKTNVVGIVGLVENMPDGKAIKPGDVVTSRKGLTVENQNTDAEGRLVLADIMNFVQTEYKPHTMIDLATLTGACMAALGYDYAGLFTFDDKLADKVAKAGVDSGELTWRLPLTEKFANAMKGKTADLSNMSGGRLAGASTAAGFLSRFAEKGVDWAHLDIAGPAIPASGIGSGYGVRLLDRLVADNFEGKGAKQAAAPQPKP
jgi:leucyl aminopeptidase